MGSERRTQDKTGVPGRGWAFALFSQFCPSGGESLGLGWTLAVPGPFRARLWSRSLRAQRLPGTFLIRFCVALRLF